ncbi:DUF1285 domain-containing protein [Hyphococcus sp. DH-69]|uniref:DUF1285 domain-containing protein n=1 Tax=Hyphococcus formosus TaxID=3143534 RepID=UPI00398AB0F9
MTDLMRYAAELEKTDGKSLPPVEKWNPDFCGDIDMVIKSDGTWFYEGTPIGRARLVRLFSTVLKREGDKHFLVTPVEKLGITVEDAPFLAVLMNVEGADDDRTLKFTTNVGDEVVAGPEHPIEFRKPSTNAEGKPYIHVRAGLEALIARPVFYDLVSLGEIEEIDGEAVFGVRSAGEFFAFGAADEIFDGSPIDQSNE